jgi:RimJ/RimL family protein N-acetyltransferase
MNAPYLDWFQTIDDARTYVRTALDGQKEGITLPFVIFDRETGQIVGTTRYADISPEHRSLEIGWTWYHPSVWRSRVNTECKYLLLRHGFETLGTVRIQLKTDLRNERSQKAITRLGAVREGVLRNHRIMKDGYVRHTVMFSIMDSEWPDVKQRLEQFIKNGAHFVR